MEVLTLPSWLVWVVVTVVLVLVDLILVGTQFILMATGLAALLGGALAAFGVGLAGQLWGFVLGTAVLVPTMTRLLRTRFARREPAPRDPGWERGARVSVVVRGDRLVAKLKSDYYPVRLISGGKPREGETLIVDRMEGITLIAYRPEAD